MLCALKNHITLGNNWEYWFISNCDISGTRQ